MFITALPVLASGSIYWYCSFDWFLFVDKMATNYSIGSDDESSSAVSDIDEEYEVGNLFARRAMQGYQGEPEVSTVIILYIIKAERFISR